MEKEDNSLAFEMLKEMKSSNKRKDIIIMFLIATILIIVGLFVWYINTPVEETYTQEMNATTDGDFSEINQQIGDNS